MLNYVTKCLSTSWQQQHGNERAKSNSSSLLSATSTCTRHW